MRQEGIGKARVARIKLRHLQCFLGVVQHGSLQKAADALSVSQPAASKTLAELEGILEVSLFERGRNGMLPTAAALTFQRYAAACLVSLQDGVEAATRIDDRVIGRLRIGILPTLIGQWVGQGIQQFLENWPGVSLHIATGANGVLLEGIRDAQFDLAIGRITDPTAMAGLSFEYLLGEPLAVCVGAAHPLTVAGALAGPELGAYRLILPPAGTLIREAANRILASLGVESPAPSIETLSVSVGRQLTRDHDFVWLVPKGAVQQDVDDGILRSLPLSTAGSDEPIGLILPAELTPTPGLRALLGALRATAVQATRRR